MKRFGEACDGGHAPIVSGTETSESFSWKRSGLAPDPQHTLTGKGLHGRASRMRCGASCLPAGGVSLRSPTGCHQPPTKIGGSALCPAWHWPLQRQGRAFFLMLASCLGSLQNTASTSFPSHFSSVWGCCSARPCISTSTLPAVASLLIPRLSLSACSHRDLAKLPVRSHHSPAPSSENAPTCEKVRLGPDASSSNPVQL